MTATPVANGRWGRAVVLVLAGVLVLGLIQLPTPFEADQTTFTLGARALSHGGLLYRDFWDTKPPGIFAFYWAAGRMFGFHELGVHAFELIYLLGFSIVLMRCVWTAYRDRVAALLAPLLTVGAYYAVAGDWHLTQVEAVAGGPIFLSLWYASRPARNPADAGRRSFLSGMAGGLAVLFKPQFLPIVAGFWIVATVLGRSASGRALAGRPLTRLLAASLGMLVALVPVVAVYAASGALRTLWWTLWEYPLYVNAQWSGWRYDVLVDGLGWFVYRWAPILALAMLGVGADARGENRLLTMNLVLWAVMGFAVIIAQRVSWWQYHYLLLLVPLGLLGARGASMLWQVLEPWGRRRVRWLPSLRAAGALLLFAGIIGSAVARGALLAHERLALRPADRARYQMRMGKAYAQALPEVAFLGQPGRLPGAIFVIGGQEYYYLSGRPQAGHPKGNRFFKFLTPGEWDRLAGDLAAAPPSYVFVQSDHLDIVRRPARATARFRQFLEGRYRQVRSSAAGVWYERREAGAQPQASGTTRPVCRATSRCRSWATFTTGTGDQRHPTLRGAMAARDYSMTVMRRVAS